MNRPEYACEDDGLGGLVTEATLYYVIQGKDFVDESYQSGNFSLAEIRARDIRRNRVEAREAPKDQTTLQEYQMAYRRYINHRSKNRREGKILAAKVDHSETTSGAA